MAKIYKFSADEVTVILGKRLSEQGEFSGKVKICTELEMFDDDFTITLSVYPQDQATS